MTYRAPWMDEVQPQEVKTVPGFGTLWIINFNEDDGHEEEEFEVGQEQDAKEAAEDRIARTFKSRYMVIRGDMSEVWTSSEEEGLRLLGAENTLFA